MSQNSMTKSPLPAADQPPHKDKKEPPSSQDEGKKVSWLARLLKPASEEEELREAIEDYIENKETESASPSVETHEKILIGNVLEMRDLRVWDVMIPRVEMAAIQINASEDELMTLLSDRQFSRLPVYGATLDDILGSIHIKDILARMAAKKPVIIRDLLRDVPMVISSMPVMDLILQMRQSKKHMFMAVDEYGGIDGLVTLGDVIEAIVGEMDDEFDNEEQPRLITKPDGSILVDARYDIEEFEEQYGEFMTPEERDEIDTLGGLVFAMAGRVPARGEQITHSSGLIFEIMDTDNRRIKTLKIKNPPVRSSSEK
ncbi:MAG: HlyC/CorC family transporter [Alphaproteobacteria bacterium]|nr:HlyC/CorC family transporter [Alphaproteobacteria bacterium]